MANRDDDEDEPRTQSRDYQSLLFLQQDTVLTKESSSSTLPCSTTTRSPLLLTGTGLDNKDSSERGAIRRLSLIYSELCADGTLPPSNYVTRPETLRVMLSETLEVEGDNKEQDVENEAPDEETEIIVAVTSTNKKRRLM